MNVLNTISWFFNFLRAWTILLDHCLGGKYQHKVKCGFDIFATSLRIPDDFKRKPDWEYYHHPNSDFSLYPFFQEVSPWALEHRTSSLKVTIKH